MNEKPINYEVCHCGSKLYLTSIIPENWQVNLICSNELCGSWGFVLRGKLYLQRTDEYSYNLVYTPPS